MWYFDDNKLFINYYYVFIWIQQCLFIVVDFEWIGGGDICYIIIQLVVFKVSGGYGVNVGIYGDIGGCNVN